MFLSFDCRAACPSAGSILWLYAVVANGVRALCISLPKTTFDAAPPASQRFPAGGPRAAVGPRRDSAAPPVRSAPRSLLIADFPPLSALRREKTAASLPGFISTPLASGKQGDIGETWPQPRARVRGSVRAGDRAPLRARCKPRPGGVSGQPLPWGLQGSPKPHGAAPSPSAAASPRPSPITGTATQPALPLPAGREEAGFKRKHRSAARWIIFALVWCLTSTLSPPHIGGT